MPRLLAGFAALLILTGLPLAALTPEQQSQAEGLLEITDPEDFLTAWQKAVTEGLPAQTLLEVRFLHFVESPNGTTQLRDLVRLFESFQGPFRAEDSLAFSIPEDFEAIRHYLQALQALERQDDPAFKAHITEAFWLSPKQSQIFGPHIEHHRLNQILANLRVPLELTFPAQFDNAPPVSLRSLFQDSRLLLLHFWSPWSPNLQEHLPGLDEQFSHLRSRSVPVVSMLMPGTADHLQEARDFLRQNGLENHGTWLLDHPQHSLAALLRLSEVPAFVLLSHEGKVLFYGKPGDDRLGRVLEAYFAN